MAQYAGWTALGSGGTPEEALRLEIEQERRRAANLSDEDLRRQYAIDPLRRLGQFGQRVQRNPWSAPLETLGLIGELPATPVRLIAGGLQGVTQTAALQNRWDAPGRLQQLAQEAPDVPVVGGLVAGARAGWETLGAAAGAVGNIGRPVPTIPAEDRVYSHGDWDSERFRTLPASTDPFDPSLNLARYHALTPPLAQMGIEMAGMGAVQGAASRIGQAVVNPVVRGAVQAVTPGLELGALTGKPAMGGIAAALGSRAVQAALNLGLPMAAGAAGIMAGLHDAYEPRVDPTTGETLYEIDVPKAVIGGSLGALFGVIGARAAASGLSRLSGVAGVGAHMPEPVPNVPLGAAGREWWEGTRAARAAGEGVAREVEGVAPQYPGGVNRYLLTDAFRQFFSDRIARLQTWQDQVVNAKLIKATDPHALFYDEARLIAGVPAAAGEWQRQYSANMSVAGVTHRAVPVYDLYTGTYMAARDAIDRGIETGTINKVNAGRAGVSLAQYASDALADVARQVDAQFGGTGFVRRYGAPPSEKWVEAMRANTVLMNGEVDRLVASGLVSVERATAMKAERDVYTAFRDILTHMDDLFDPTGQRVLDGLSTVATGLGRRHSSSEAPEFSSAINNSRTLRMMKYAQQNTVARGLVEASEADARLAASDPTWQAGLSTFVRRVELPRRPEVIRDDLNGQNFRVIQQELRSLLNDTDYHAYMQSLREVAPSSGKYRVIWQTDASQVKVPDGWGLLPVARNGEFEAWMAPKDFADMMRGLTAEQGDWLTKWYGKAANMFRAGITTLSFPFILANTPRDVQSVLHNYQAPSLFLKHFLPAMGDQVVNGLEEFLERHPQAQQAMQNGIAQSLLNWARGGQAEYRNAQRALGMMGSITEDVRYGVARAGGEMAQGLNLARGVTPGKSALGQGLERAENLGRGMLEILNPAHLLATMSEFGEMTTRLAVFRAEKERLLDAGWTHPEAIGRQAAMAMRSMTVDFPKGGEVVKLLNRWLPLLNARQQGTLRSWESFYSDPWGFGMRAYVTSALPTIATQAWNQEMFPEAYAQVPQRDRDTHHIIMLGTWADARGHDKPLYLGIPKDEVSAFIATPLEHLIQTATRARAGERVLGPDQRTDRPWDVMLLQTLLRLVPINLNPDDILNPDQTIAAAFSMSPLIGTGMQLWANRDTYRDEPILRPELLDLPPEYRATPRTPTAYKMIGQLLKNAGLPDNLREWAAPARLEFMVRGLGGTAAALGVAFAGDRVYDILGRAGMIPPNAFQPTKPEDLALPPGTNAYAIERRMGAIEDEDLRPLPAKILGRIVRTGGGADQIRARVEQTANPALIKQHDQTQQYWQRYMNRQYEIERERQEYLANLPVGATHAQIAQRMADLDGRLRDYRLGLSSEMPLAADTPPKRRALEAAIPGLPVANYFQSLPQLPPGITPQMVAERYRSADQSIQPESTPWQQWQLRKRTLSVMADQYNLPTSVLQAYIGGYALGQELPAIGVPAIYMDTLVDEYMSPPGTDANTPGQVLGAARRRVVEQRAREWEIPQEVALQWIRARLNWPDYQHPTTLSRELAHSLQNDLADTTKYPLLATPNGQPYGDPQTHGYLLEEVLRWRELDPQLKHAPPYIKELERARRWGEARRVMGRFYDQDGPPTRPSRYADWARWYGIGRQMTPADWERFQSGEMPRYRRPGITPDEQFQMDAAIAIYEAMPDGPEKRSQRSMIRQYRRLQTPRWRDLSQEAGRQAILEQLTSLGLARRPGVVDAMLAESVE